MAYTRTLSVAAMSLLAVTSSATSPSVRCENAGVAKGQAVDIPIVLSIDDGSYESNRGYALQDGSAGSQGVALNRFTPDPNLLPLTIDTVSMLFPLMTPGGISTRLEPGMPFDVLVYVDPSGSGNPANTSLAVRQPFSLAPSDTIVQEVRLESPVLVQSGDVWVGFTNTVTRSDSRAIYPLTIDLSSEAQGRSWGFSNSSDGSSHFGGDVLSEAASAGILPYNFLIRAGARGGTQICWDAPLQAGDKPPPANARACASGEGAAGVGDDAGRGAPSVRAYRVYRSSTPNVQTTPANLFTTTPPNMTTVGSTVAPGGSFFVVTAVYDEGESGPSNEVGVVPPTVTTLKVKPTKITVKGRDFTDTVTVFVDGIPFVAPALIKANNTKLVQRGTLLTGESVGQYLDSHGGRARIVFRNDDGSLTATDFER